LSQREDIRRREARSPRPSIKAKLFHYRLARSHSQSHRGPTYCMGRHIICPFSDLISLSLSRSLHLSRSLSPSLSVSLAPSPPRRLPPSPAPLFLAFALSLSVTLSLSLSI